MFAGPVWPASDMGAGGLGERRCPPEVAGKVARQVEVSDLGSSAAAALAEGDQPLPGRPGSPSHHKLGAEDGLQSHKAQSPDHGPATRWLCSLHGHHPWPFRHSVSLCAD